MSSSFLPKVRCNWCSRLLNIYNKEKYYCINCKNLCERECIRCHRPFPSLYYFPNHKSKRCNSCSKKYEKEKQKNKKKYDCDNEKTTKDIIAEERLTSKINTMSNNKKTNPQEYSIQSDDGENEEKNLTNMKNLKSNGEKRKLLWLADYSSSDYSTTTDNSDIDEENNNDNNNEEQIEFTTKKTKPSYKQSALDSYITSKESSKINNKTPKKKAEKINKQQPISTTKNLLDLCVDPSASTKKKVVKPRRSAEQSKKYIKNLKLMRLIIDVLESEQAKLIAAVPNISLNF